MQFKRKAAAVLIVLLLILANIPVTHADSGEIPQAFWSLSESYGKALESKDNDNIIKYGKEIIDLFKGSEDTPTAVDIITPKLYDMAKAYEAQGDYASTIEYYKKYIPKAEKLGWFSGVTTRLFEIAILYEKLGDYDNTVEYYKQYIPRADELGWTDGVTYAKAKIAGLSFDIDLYTLAPDVENNKYFGAKYEPKSGIYFGSAYDKDPRINTYVWDKIKSYFPKKNAAYLIYLTWGTEASSYDRHFQDAKKNGIGVELAWNIQDPNIVRDVPNKKAYIERTAQYLKDLGIPVLLRFANEMNEGPQGEDSAAYIKAFRFVSDIVRKTAPNVAMLWSPNDISAAGRSFGQYYPGDEYVDWVGISSYADYYFLGQKQQGDVNNTTYFAGEYANPIAKMKAFMDYLEQSGIKKPVMISETGIGHYSRTQNEDLTDWAKVQLRRLYTYAPMVYPQLKGIYYFNTDVADLKVKYGLYFNQSMNDEYNKLVASDYYISSIGQNAPYRYQKITDYTLAAANPVIMTYTIPPKVLKPVVRYKIDGAEYAVRNEVPYTVQLEPAKLPEGMHSLTIEVCDGTNVIKSKSYDMLCDAGKISLRIRPRSGESVFSKMDIPDKVRYDLGEAVILYLGSPKAYANSAEVRIDPGNNEVVPALKNDRTLVPVRFISEKLGADITWDSLTSTATVTLGSRIVKLTLGNSTMLVNNEAVKLDVPADTINDRIFIPLRALTEALGKKVFFDSNLIIISDKDDIIDKSTGRPVIDKLISCLNALQ